jgi:MFS family permease
VNKALRALYIYNGIFVLAGGLFGPLYALYVSTYIDSTIDPVVIVSLSWGIFLIASTLFTFIVSKFGDGIKEKEYLLLWGFLLKAIVWVLYIYVNSLAFLIILQILLGLGEALGSPSFNSLMAQHVDRNRRIEEYSDMTIIFNLSAGLATILGGFIVAIFGFPTLFIIMSILAVVSFFGILLKPRRLL